MERLVFIDLYEYRLNPTGNSYLWDGVAGGHIGVVEAGGAAYWERMNEGGLGPDPVEAALRAALSHLVEALIAAAQEMPFVTSDIEPDQFRAAAQRIGGGCTLTQVPAAPATEQ